MVGALVLSVRGPAAMIGVLVLSVSALVALAPAATPTGAGALPQPPSLGAEAATAACPRAGGFVEEDEASFLQASAPRGFATGAAEQQQQRGPPSGGERAGAEAAGADRAISAAVEGAVSIMLVGTVAFMMLLFYMVNFPDDDVRYYTSQTLGDAISIFVAVLVYEATNKCIMGLSPAIQDDVLRVGQFCLWFVLLQGGTAWLSGAIWDNLDIEDEYEEELEAQLRNRELRVRCISGVLAHITGFAAISASIELQSKGGLGSPAVHVTLMVPITAVVMLGICQLSCRARLWIADLSEKSNRCDAIWHTAALIAESDAASLASSFVSVNAVQFFVLGVVPNRHGGVEVSFPLAAWRDDAIFLLAGAAATGGVTLALVLLAERLEQACPSLTEVVRLFLEYASMCFAWFLLFAAKAIAHCAHQASSGQEQDAEHIIPKVLTALGVSAFVFLAIVALDVAGDALGHGDPTQQALVKVILSLGILVGFAWELCFSSAIEAIDARVPGPDRALGLVLSVGFSALVMPAYLLLIAPVTEACRREVLMSMSDSMRRSSRMLSRSVFSKLYPSEKSGGGDDCPSPCSDAAPDEEGEFRTTVALAPARGADVYVSVLRRPALESARS